MIWLVEGDLFHPSFAAGFIVSIYEIMKAAEQHKFVILTEYPERIIPVLYGEEGNHYLNHGSCIQNVWHLVVVKNQETADKRIPELLKLREVSIGWPILGAAIEPMLGPVNLRVYIEPKINKAMFEPGARCGHHGQLLFGKPCPTCFPERLDWIICGGGDRPLNPAWVRNLRDQCQAAGVPFFFSQWGKWTSARLKDVLESSNIKLGLPAQALVLKN